MPEQGRGQVFEERERQLSRVSRRRLSAVAVSRLVEVIVIPAIHGVTMAVRRVDMAA